MKSLILAGLMLAAGMANADSFTYADNAILNAAESGVKRVTLVFGDAPQDEIDRVADDLRARGYMLDEQTELLNPRIIKVLRLKAQKGVQS